VANEVRQCDVMAHCLCKMRVEWCQLRAVPGSVQVWAVSGALCVRTYVPVGHGGADRLVSRW